MPVVVSIGTSHPWNIAGTGLDILIGEEFAVRVLTVIVGVSAQNGHGLHALHPVPLEVVKAQLDAMPWREVDAARVGAFASADAVDAVATAARANPKTPFVVDPVFSATLGGSFGGDGVIDAMRNELASLANVILTPNLDEAAQLLGRTHIARTGIANAAAELRERGALAVLVKGGHLDGEPADALATASSVDAFVGERLGATMRGTGCTLAMALACEMARGLPLLEAVQSARAFVRARIARQHRFMGLNVPY